MDHNTSPWPEPPLGGGAAPGPAGMGAGPLGDWQPERDQDADTDAPKGKKAKKAKRGKKADPEQAATRSVANKRRLMALGLAGIAGIALLYGSSDTAPSTYVVRTAQPVSSLTAMTDSLVEAVTLPEEAVETDAFTGETAEEALEAFLADHQGQRVQYPLTKGEQVSVDDFVLGDRLAVDLGADERLISLDASIARAVGGDLRVGDTVDVIAADSQSQLTAVLVSKVQVVDITLPEDAYSQVITTQPEEGNRDKAVDELIPGDPLPGTYTLRVKADDAYRIATAAANVTVMLSYSAPNADPLQTGPVTLTDVMCGLDRPDLPGSYLEALPAACRDVDGNVDYSPGTGGDDDDLYMPEDADDASDTLEPGTEG